MLFSFLGIITHKVAQTWFVLHETWYTILFGIYFLVEVVRIENNSRFGIYYSIEMVRIENNSPMIEITCFVAVF